MFLSPIANGRHCRPTGGDGSLLILGKTVEAADTADKRAFLEAAILSVHLPAGIGSRRFRR